MSTHNLDRLWNPKSVAVIGASEKQGSVGCAIMKNLLAGSDRCKIFPVNPWQKKMFDLPCFARVQEIAGAVDMAVIATPMPVPHSTMPRSASPD